jgi:transcriptional regulator with XRE-family HTH domain
MGKTNFNELREHLESTPQGRQELERARGEVAQALRLADLRWAQSWTQETLAEALDTNQSGVSRIERQTDLYVSTLRRYVEALGGRLELRAVFDDDREPVEIDQLAGGRGRREDEEPTP